MEKLLGNITVVRIAALVLGMLLWVVVHLDQQTTSVPSTPSTQTRSISDVQITTVGLNTDLYYIQSIDPTFVNIVLSGKASAVNNVSTIDGKSQIRLDLSAVTAGVHTLPLQNVGFPSGVRVEIYPPNVTLVVEEVLKKEVPVEIVLEGKPMSGFKAGVPIMSPSRVNVTGPSSQLDAIVSVRAVVDITNAQEAVEVSERLVAVNAEGIEVEADINPQVVTVEVPITSPFKTVPLQINILNHPAPGFSVASVRQSINEVTIYGPEDALNGIDYYDELDIDLSGLTGNRSYTLRLPVLPGIQRVLPDEVSVNINIVPSVQKTIEQLPITLSGVNDEFETTIVTPETGAIDVVVEGALSILNNVSAENIQAIVDVSNLPPGLYQRTIKLNLPAYVKVGGDQDLVVSIEIKEKTEETTGNPTADPTNEDITQEVSGETSENNS
jgi:YbbR domain-containing protein